MQMPRSVLVEPIAVISTVGPVTPPAGLDRRLVEGCHNVVLNIVGRAIVLNYSVSELIGINDRRAADSAAMSGAKRVGPALNIGVRSLQAFDELIKGRRQRTQGLTSPNLVDLIPVPLCIPSDTPDRGVFVGP